MHFSGRLLLVLLLMSYSVWFCHQTCVYLDILSSKADANAEVNVTFVVRSTGTCADPVFPLKGIEFVSTTSEFTFCLLHHDYEKKVWTEITKQTDYCTCLTMDRYWCGVQNTVGRGWKVTVTLNGGRKDTLNITEKQSQITSLTINGESTTTTTTTTTSTTSTATTTSITTTHQDHTSTLETSAIHSADSVDISIAVAAAAAAVTPAATSADTTAKAATTVVDVHSTVTISCSWSEGLPASDAQLTLNGLDLNAVEGPATSNHSQRLRHIHHVIPHVRCENTGLVACGLPGSEVNSTHALVVRCPPSRRYDVGTVTNDSDPVSLTFDVTANPPPERLTFFYLGTSITDTHPTEISDSQIQLTGVCQPKPGVVYQSTCTVTVTNVNMDTVSSFYQVTVTNGHGSGHFRFQVLCKGCGGGSSGAESDAPSYLGFAVGVCAVLAVIVIIIIVLIVVWRRRRALLHTGASNSTDTNNPTGSNSPASHGNPAGPNNPIGSNSPASHGNPAGSRSPTGGSDAVFMRNTTDSSARVTTSGYDYPHPVPQLAEQTGLYASVNLDDVGQRAVYSRLRSHGKPTLLPTTTQRPGPGNTPHAAGFRLPSMRSPDPSDYLHPIAGPAERADIAHATGLRLQSVTSRESETYLHPIPGPADQAEKPKQAQGKATGATPSGLWKSGRSHVHDQLMEELHKEMKAQPE